MIDMFIMLGPHVEKPVKYRRTRQDHQVYAVFIILAVLALVGVLVCWALTPA